MKQIRIAVVGTGIIGRDHLKAIGLSDSCVLCALCDINEAAAQTYAAEFQVPCFTDYMEMAEKVQMDAVILNLPHWLHCQVTMYFLERGVHVLVEKPMANTVEECDRMIGAAIKNGKKLAIGHVQRFFLANQMVKEITQSGELGRLCMFEEHRSIDYFLPSRPAWFLDKKRAGGGIVMNYGAHALDKLFYITGCCDDNATASIEVRGAAANYKNDATIEGHAQMFVKLPQGVSGVVTFSGYGSFGYETVYYFTEGALRVGGGAALMINRGDGWKTLLENEDGMHMCRQLEEFCRYIRGEESLIPTGEYARAVIAAIEKVY